MLLPTQIQAILFHFLMGWVYALGFSFIISFLKYLHFTLIKGIIEILYHLIFTCLMFYGLFYINGGIINVYLIAFFMFGIIVYYSLYLNVFLQFFHAIKCVFLPFFRKLRIVKTKIIDIIRLTVNFRKRRRADGQRKE